MAHLESLLAARTMIDRIRPAPDRAILFIDFDGTLAEIVEDPERSVPVPGVLETLDRLAARLGGVVVVSGRPGAFLASRLEIASRHVGIRAFGLYGGEEVLPDGSVTRDRTRVPDRQLLEHQVPDRQVPDRQVPDRRVPDRRVPDRRFEESAAMAHLAAPNARIEEKGDSIAFHFRETPDDAAALAQVATAAAARFGLEVRKGRMVFELVAPDVPDKGVIVGRFVDTFDVGVAFGDDAGDIAAFVALDVAAGRSGFRALKIAVGSTEVPTGLVDLADVVIGSPIEVASVLSMVADALEGRSRTR